jgi:hypothetical protein
MQRRFDPSWRASVVGPSFGPLRHVTLLGVAVIGMASVQACTPPIPRDPQPLFETAQRPGRPPRPVRPRVQRPGESGQTAQQADDSNSPGQPDDPPQAPEPQSAEAPPTVPALNPLDTVGSLPPIPLPAEPASEPPPPPVQVTVAQPPPRVTGLRANDVRSRLGPPQSERSAGAARVWRYQGQGCSVDVYLYYDTRRGDFFALEQRVLGGAASAEACLATAVGSGRQG